MSELTPEARAIFEAARRASAPSDADRQRIRAALAAVVGPLPTRSPLRPEGQVGATAAPSSGLGVSVKIVLALALAGGVGIGYRALRGGAAQEPPSALPPPASQSQPAVSPPLPLPAEPPAAPAPERLEARPRPAMAPPPKFAPMDLRRQRPAPELPRELPPERPKPAAPAAAERALEEELRLLQGAQRSLRADPSRSLELLDEHERRFPHGALREERAAARVSALCALHRDDQARREAARLLAENPESPYAARVQAPCAEER